MKSVNQSSKQASAFCAIRRKKTRASLEQVSKDTILGWHPQHNYFSRTSFCAFSDVKESTLGCCLSPPVPLSY